MDIERDEELSVAHAAFWRDDRAGPGGESDVRRSGFAALRDSIWVRGKNRSKKGFFAEHL